MDTENKANGGIRKHTIQKIFLEEWKSKKKKSNYNEYTHKIKPSVPAYSACPFTSSTSSASATPETAKPNLCLLPPTQSTQHEEDRNEDIYGELLPLNEY